MKEYSPHEFTSASTAWRALLKNTSLCQTKDWYVLNWSGFHLYVRSSAPTVLENDESFGPTTPERPNSRVAFCVRSQKFLRCTRYKYLSVLLRLKLGLSEGPAVASRVSS